MLECMQQTMAIRAERLKIRTVVVRVIPVLVVHLKLRDVFRQELTALTGRAASG